MTTALSIHCVWCSAPLLDVEHAKAHVADRCAFAPWRKQIADLRAELAEARAALHAVAVPAEPTTP